MKLATLPFGDTITFRALVSSVFWPRLMCKCVFEWGITHKPEYFNTNSIVVLNLTSLSYIFSCFVMLHDVVLWSDVRRVKECGLHLPTRASPRRGRMKKKQSPLQTSLIFISV